MQDNLISYKPTVLVVDDNQDILSFLQDVLEEKYVVLTARCVKAALILLEENIIHLIVSDIMMPDINGYTFCKMIKTSLEQSHIPVILLTAKDGLKAKMEGLELGADAYIEKPFSPIYLQVQISNLLMNRSRIRSYFSNNPQSSISNATHMSVDESFLNKLQDLIIQHLDDPNLDVDMISEKLFISRPTLYRKIKVISELTPNELINITRLKKAAALLSEGLYSITEVSVMVGFNSMTHFGRCFLKEFGVSPRGFAAKNSKVQPL